jgi:hypothetical protein
MNKQTVIAEVRTKVRIPQGPSKKILEATRVHWELVEVVDFYAEPSTGKSPTHASSRARAHLGGL